MHQYDVNISNNNTKDDEKMNSSSSECNCQNKTSPISSEDEVLLKRRAAVFYVDKNDGVIAYIKWWIFSWKFIGKHLNQGY